jgi:hypothetical protein
LHTNHDARCAAAALFPKAAGLPYLSLTSGSLSGRVNPSLKERNPLGSSGPPARPRLPHLCDRLSYNAALPSSDLLHSLSKNRSFCALRRGPFISLSFSFGCRLRLQKNDDPHIGAGKELFFLVTERRLAPLSALHPFTSYMVVATITTQQQHKKQEASQTSKCSALPLDQHILLAPLHSFICLRSTGQRGSTSSLFFLDFSFIFLTRQLGLPLRETPRYFVVPTQLRRDSSLAGFAYTSTGYSTSTSLRLYCRGKLAGKPDTLQPCPRTLGVGIQRRDGERDIHKNNSHNGTG